MTIQLSFDLKLTATRPVQTPATVVEVEVREAKDLNPEVPAEALSCPKKFRQWLTGHQGQFIGGGTALAEIVAKLPKSPRLSDLIALEDPRLGWD